MRMFDGRQNGLRPKKPLSIAGRVLVIALSGMLVAACGTIPKTLTTDAATCAAIKRSPQYSGKKLEQAVGRPFRLWTAETNLTLDNLKCPKPKRTKKPRKGK